MEELTPIEKANFNIWRIQKKVKKQGTGKTVKLAKKYTAKEVNEFLEEFYQNKYEE